MAKWEAKLRDAPAHHSREGAEKIVKHLVSELSRAVALREMHALAAYREEIPAAFNNTLEAYGFNVVTNALYFELVMTLMRMFDKAGSETMSLPELVVVLRDDRVMREIEDEARRFRRDMRDRSKLKKLYRPQEYEAKTREDCEQKAAQTRKLTEAAIALYKKRLPGTHTRARLKIIRDNYYAHNAIDPPTSAEAKYGYADRLVDEIMPVIAEFALAVLDLDLDADELVETSRKKATDFWARAAQASVAALRNQD